MSTENSAATRGGGADTAATGRPRRRRGPLRLLGLTANKAWECNLFSEAAEAAFWQTLSLPPLLLGLLGSLGYVGQWFGDKLVSAVQEKIIEFSATIFSTDVVERIIEPTVGDILTVGRGEIVSVGFLISLWAGSSALHSFVDAITVAHNQYGVRNEVWQRIFALLLYMVSLVLLIVGLPIVALGPELLPTVFPDDWQPTIAAWVNYLYYPALGILTMIALATLYKLALPRKLPWHRVLPGAILAMIVFLLTSIGLRMYIAWITTTGYTYGALATPIAWLLFAFFIGLAVVLGAYFNAAIQELWPAKMTRRQRRKWRKLEMERANEHIQEDESERAWQEGTETTPLPAPAGQSPAYPVPDGRAGPERDYADPGYADPGQARERGQAARHDPETSARTNAPPPGGDATTAAHKDPGKPATPPAGPVPDPSRANPD